MSPAQKSLLNCAYYGPVGLWCRGGIYRFKANQDASGNYTERLVDDIEISQLVNCGLVTKETDGKHHGSMVLTITPKGARETFIN